jgi:hypothetical protein
MRAISLLFMTSTGATGESGFQSYAANRYAPCTSMPS